VDLRHLSIDAAQLAQLKALIRAGKIAYQPFLFREDLEVGEGWAFATDTSDSWPPRKEVIYWPEHPDDLASLAVRDENPQAFRQANAELRGWYEDNVRLIAALADSVAGHDFLELGCNSGYILHRLSMLGAKRAIGVDAADFGDVFDWFNRVTGSTAEFIHAEWDSVQHRIAGPELPEVDVAISVSVTCHVSDPLHMLAFLCRLARHAVFFMTPLSGKDDVSITFGHQPNYFRQDRCWPASFDSEVLPSAPLIEMGLDRCGFGEVSRPKENVFVAYRTGPGKSIYDVVPEPATDARPHLVEEGYRSAFNIIRFGGSYYALAQDEGEFSAAKARRGEYRRCVAGATIDDVKRQVNAWLLSAGSASV
jgi:SAM-dependent methyltransferase